MRRRLASSQTKRPKIETSKKLLWFSVIMVIIITIVTVIAVFVLQDVTPLEFVISGIFALASTATGFYYNKAKRENIIKLGGSIDNIEED